MGKEAKDSVRCTDEERHTRQPLVVGPRVAREKALRARMLLKAAGDGPHWSDGQIAAAFAVGAATIPRLRQRLVEEGLEAALTRQPPARPQPRKRDGAQEARLVALACSQAPEGRAAWTLHRLAEQLGALEMVEAIGRDTGRPTRKKCSQARAEGAMGHTAGGACRVRLCDGRPLGGVSATVGRAPAAGLLRCRDQAMGEGRPHADPGSPRTSGAHRRHGRTPWDRDSVHDV